MTLWSLDLNKNDCYKYAALRNILYRKGKEVEVLVSYEPCFTMMNEWWKQLYGESEGKDQQGPVPGLGGVFHRSPFYGAVYSGWQAPAV